MHFKALHLEQVLDVSQVARFYFHLKISTLNLEILCDTCLRVY